MPSDVMRDVTPQEVTPVAGKGALGTWLSHRIRTCKAGLFYGIESGVNQCGQGCMCVSA